jgi:excisionase family DNA binding protein
MNKRILINKKQVAGLLGGISESQVLRLIRNKKLPCIRLTRGTILFELKAVQKWAETRPTLRKTAKQKAEAKRRRAEAETRKLEREDAEFMRLYQQRIGNQQQTYTAMEGGGQQEATA